MSHKYEHVSTGNGYWVSNPDGSGRTQVITQAGVVKGDIKDSLAEGSIYVGDNTGITSEFAAEGANKFLIGNGTTLVSAVLSGEVTNVAGAVTINADAITTVKILDDNVTTAKIADSAVTPDKQSFPKYNIYQETLPVASFTDNLNTTGQIDLSTTIPAGSIMLYAIVNNIVGFAGDTTATFTIGDGSTVDRYNTGTPNCFATAADGVDVGAVSGTAWHTADATPRVTVTGASDFGLIVTEGNGTMDVTLAWIDPQGVVV